MFKQLGKFWGKITRKEKREKFLEENYIQRNFALNLDTDILTHNLGMLEEKLRATNRPYNLSKTDVKYITKRLREKGRIIKEGYNDGKHDEFIAIAKSFISCSDDFSNKYEETKFRTSTGRVRKTIASILSSQPAYAYSWTGMR